MKNHLPITANLDSFYSMLQGVVRYQKAFYREDWTYHFDTGILFFTKKGLYPRVVSIPYPLTKMNQVDIENMRVSIIEKIYYSKALL